MDIINLIMSCIGIAFITSIPYIMQFIVRFKQHVENLRKKGEVLPDYNLLPDDILKNVYKFMGYVGVSIFLACVNIFFHKLFIVPVLLYIVGVGFMFSGKLSPYSNYIEKWNTVIAAVITWGLFTYYGFSYIIGIWL